MNGAIGDDRTVPVVPGATGVSLLYVHRAERADTLVAALAEVLSDPLSDPLAPEVVAVHSRGIERWISQELSLRLGVGASGNDGVCANLEFPFPGRLIRRAVAQGSGIDPERDPWLPDHLTWPLLELVDEHRDAAMLGPLRRHVVADDPEDPVGRSRRLGAIRHIADLFDRYGVHRPEMILRWKDGDDVGADGHALPARHRWQAELWRAVHQRLRQPSFAERRESALAALRRDPDLLDLPDRVALFGLTALPATYLHVLSAIAAHRDVHLLLLHPSAELWDRVAAHLPEDGSALWARDRDPTAEAPRNPLLRSWGRDARELQLVAPSADVHQHHPVDIRQPLALLERIQSDIRADRFPGSGSQRPVLDADDRSVQVHDCHGRLRQVEVLRDTIHHLLARDPSLEPRDIIVMCPDIETFAPLVTAVFGAVATSDETVRGPADAPPPFRIRLADRSIRRTNAVLEVVTLVLDLVDGRVTASSVIDLLSREPVRRRFGFDDDEVGLLEDWIADLQIRWGLDGQHRQRHGLPALDANTWQAGLERLQLGIAMADEDLRMIDATVPFDGVEGQSSDLAGRLTELVARLSRVIDSMRTPRTISGWRRAIGEAADALTATHPDDGWQRQQLHRVLERLVDESRSDDTDPAGDEACPVELELHEVKALLADRLEGRPTTTSHRTGDLTICTLVPMRSVPHRVVCLLGMDDGAFPRQTVPDSDDLLLDSPRVGDRDPRSEDRQLLLDAVLAATDTLVVTYAGRDVRTNEPRPPAVPVDELLDVIDRTVTTGDGTRPSERVTTRHPLTEHDPRNFTPGLLVQQGPWGFDPATLAAAQAHRREPNPARPFLDGELSPPDEDVIDLADLVGFLQHPCKAFLRQRLDVTLPGQEDELSDAIPASLKGLDAWKVGDEMLRQWLAGHDLDRVEAVLRARGIIPPGDLATEDLRDVRHLVEQIMGLCGHLDIEPGRRRTVDVQVELPDGRLLSGPVSDVQGWRLESIGYSKVAAKHRLAAWARFLAVSAQEPDRPWNAATLGRHPWKRGKVQAVLLPTLRGGPADVRATATSHLGRLIDLYDRGQRSPLPLYCQTSAKIAQNIRDEHDPTRYVDKEWETSPYGSYDQEDLDPYHVAVLGGQLAANELFVDPCRDEVEDSWSDDGRRVVAYAWRLWEPILDAEQSRIA